MVVEGEHPLKQRGALDLDPVELVLMLQPQGSLDPLPPPRDPAATAPVCVCGRLFGNFPKPQGRAEPLGIVALFSVVPPRPPAALNDLPNRLRPWR
jgi:hypothetical protein